MHVILKVIIMKTVQLDVMLVDLQFPSHFETLHVNLQVIVSFKSWSPMVDSMQVRSQPVFSGKPEGPFCLFCTFIFRNERNWMKKSARVSEKLVSPGLPGLQVATHLVWMPI